MSYFTRLLFVWLMFFCTFVNILFAQPVSTRNDIKIKLLASVSTSSVRIAHDPASSNLYILENNGYIKRVNFAADSTVTFTIVYQPQDHTLTEPLGMAFAQDGTMFLVDTKPNGQSAVSTIMRGIPDIPGSEKRTWNVLAKTVEYLYGFTYNHRMSGIIVDPGGDYIYVNSGARTDHGEVREGYRDVGLTSIILKLPINGDNILLQNEREWLRSHGYLMAEGIRNDFDFAYNANNDLFSVENSGDRDDPEEMNWIREGHHYGFPWRLGGNNTPQQFTPYDPTKDPLLSPSAWGGGNLYVTFSNDPDYPERPDSITFTEPITSSGPDADKFRDPLTGEVKDASDLGQTITTFSPHRSPDGIVFDKDSVLAGDLSGGAFVISIANGSILHSLGDSGEDLLHLALTKKDSTYTAKVTRLISGFTSPLGIEMVDNKLYILETGLWNNNYLNPKLWEITLPKKGIVDVKKPADLKPNNFELSQNYPNPFNPSTRIQYTVSGRSAGNNSSNAQLVTLKVYDIMGKEVATLVNGYKKPGNYEVEFSTGSGGNGSGLSSGVYFYQLRSAGIIITKKLMLIR